jgi:hypothetical protein
MEDCVEETVLGMAVALCAWVFAGKATFGALAATAQFWNFRVEGFYVNFWHLGPDCTTFGNANPPTHTVRCRGSREFQLPRAQNLFKLN